MSNLKPTKERMTVTLDEILSFLSRHHMNSHGEDLEDVTVYWAGRRKMEVRSGLGKAVQERSPW